MSIPDTANSRSGKISVCTRVLVSNRRSAGDPATTAAEATIALPVSTLRSAISSTDRIAITRIVAWMNNAKPSMATAPPAVTTDVSWMTPTATRAATRPTTVTTTWAA